MSVFVILPFVNEKQGKSGAFPPIARSDHRKKDPKKPPLSRWTGKHFAQPFMLEGPGA